MDRSPVLDGAFLPAGLLPGERVLWSGRPRPWLYVRRRLLPAWPVAAALLALVVLWEWDAIVNNHATVWMAAGWLFLPAGLYGAFVRPVLLLAAARRRAYAITTMRVMWLRRRRGANEVECSIRLGPGTASLPQPADVQFAGPPPRQSRWGWWGIGDDGSLACVADAAHVVAALEHARDAGRLRGWTSGIVTP